MKNTFGASLQLTLFGESHGEAIGAVIDGLSPGIEIDGEFISRQLARRRPAGDISTPRREPDAYRILSGVANGRSTGTPLCIIIENKDVKSQDYSLFSSVARPGHADYTAFCKYHGYQDSRGGGHFSGRITAALVAAGAIVQAALEKKGIFIGTHIKRCAAIDDADFSNIAEDIKSLASTSFPVLDGERGEQMKSAIKEAREQLDSVGGVLETAVIGLPAGVGEPWFDSVESILSHALFSIPAVKGVEFGDGFSICDKRGSDANDQFLMENGKVKTLTNHNGGINGGITNGMPLLFRCAIKPTPSIARAQSTVNFISGEDTVLETKGRHDPAIVHRACAVVDATVAIALADLLLGRFGSDWLAD